MLKFDRAKIDGAEYVEVMMLNQLKLTILNRVKMTGLNVLKRRR